MSNWFVQWERHRDEKYKNKIFTGIDSLSKMPYRLNSGPALGYDPETGHLKYMGVGVYSFHMINFFGALEAWLEFAEDADIEEWKEMYGEYGRYAFVTPEEKRKIYPDEDPANKGFYYQLSPAAGVAALYYAKRHGDSELINRVWHTIINREDRDGVRSLDCQQCNYGGLDVVHPFREPTHKSGDAGFPRLFMNMFFALELGRDYIPDDEIAGIEKNEEK